MKNMIEGAMRQAASIAMPFMEQAFASSGELTPRQQLSRYELLHRGNPVATAQFISKNAPSGVPLMQAWRDYESAMEKLRSELGGAK